MSIAQDVRFALRLLRKSPAFTIVAVLTLGLAVAANTVVFSVVNAVLVRPLPYPDSQRLVRIDTQFPTQQLDKFWVSGPEYLALVRDSRSYESIGAWTSDRINLTGGNEPVAVDAVDATASMLPTVGVQPALGRFFDESEDQPGEVRAVVIGYGLWQRAFGGDREIIGKTVHINSVAATVVGVMPRGFDFPVAGTEAWLPVGINPAKARPSNHYLTIVARLKGSTAIGQARAELTTLESAWKSDKPHDHVIGPNHPMIATPLYEDVVAPARIALVTLQAAVIFVLLIACANVSNLLLARAEARSGEIAVRAAVGATRGRMARQFLTESLVLGVLGAAVGVGLAVWGLDATVALLPDDVPRAQEIALDGPVLAFAVGVSIVASLVFGLAPILHAHGNLGETLRSAAHRATGSARKQIFRRALVVVEVGLAIVLVTGAGLMVRSFVRLQHVNLGFEPRGLVTLDVQLDARTYETDEQAQAYWTRLREGAAALPGATSATLVYGIPPSRSIVANTFEIPDKTWTKEMPEWGMDFWQSATDGFLETMGARLVAGRTVLPTDTMTSEPVILVNEAFARKYFPGEETLGKRIILSPGSNGTGKPETIQTIVGIVADMKQQGVDAPSGTEAYIPLRQSKQVGFTPLSAKLLVRTGGDPRALLGSVRAFAGSIDPRLPISNVRTMDRVVSDAIAKPRFVATLLSTFAAIALVMAAIGIYGVMSYTVERRTQELGIRMALGADAGRLKRMLVKQGLVLAGLGVALGLVAAGVVSAVLGHWLARLLFEVGALDPATYVLVVALTLGTAALACYLPARRATRVHPMTALRHE